MYRCRIRKRKCDAGRPYCSNCVKGEAEPSLTCTYTIQSKKRGPKRGFKEESMSSNSPPIIKRDLVAQPASRIRTMDEFAIRRPSGETSGNEYAAASDPRKLINDGGLFVRTEFPAHVQEVAYDKNPFSMESQAMLDTSGSGLPRGALQATDMGLDLASSLSLSNNSLGDSSLIFDFGESIFSFQSIIGQSLVPPAEWASIANGSVADSDPTSTPTYHIPSSTEDKFDTHPFGSSYVLSDLEENLVELFFAFISMKVFCFHEPYFLSNLHPTNKHPAYLIHAICAVTSLFSNHPDVKKFGTTANACAEYTARSMNAIESIETNIDIDSDCIEIVQSLMLLALVEYGFNQPVKAYRKMVMAIQMAIRLKIDREDPNVAINPLSVWVDKTSFYSPDKLLARRKLWEFCLYFDTCVGFAGGLPLIIHESSYVYLLSVPANMNANFELDFDSIESFAKTSKASKVKDIIERDRVKVQEGHARLRQILKNPTKLTLFTSLDIPLKPRPDCIYEKYHVIMNQLCFLLRRVIRINYTIRTIASRGSKFTQNSIVDPGSQILEALVAPPQDVVSVHNAIIDFYQSLPSSYKPFLSFTQFFSSRKTSSNFQQLADDFDPSALHVISIITNIINGLVILHLPRTDDSRAIFRLDAQARSYKSVSSAEVVLVARNAMEFLVRGVLPLIPDDSSSFPQGGTPETQSNQSASEFAVNGGLFADGNGTSSSRGPDVMTGVEDADDVEPTFATSADEKVHSIVGPKDPHGSLRSRLPLSTLVSAEPKPVRSRRDRLEGNFGVFCDPVVGYNLFSVAVAGIAVGMGGSGKNQEFNRGVLLRLERSIKTLDLPVMDCITFIWPVCGSLSERLKRVLKSVRTKLEEFDI
ncbi:hypothetical protein HDU82_003481 [Entophlyctis luteolus]|nr:hypothetical protein HDU82_003481 [Entophlyctis luteolus]KAJ3384289.1 hypothetical protein HDU84_003056 [Entophlyctis sp. JEL0112]